MINNSNHNDSYCRVYKIRWLMLFILWLLNFTNGILWISLSSISDKITILFNLKDIEMNMLASVFPLFIAFVGIPIIWFIDKIGLKFSMLTTAWLHFLSSILRYFAIVFSKDLGYWTLLISQILGAIAQPLVMFLPARLAFLWFPVNFRASATTISAMGNPLGILIGTAIPPQIQRLNIQAIIVLTLSLFGALLASFGIRRSSPILPASPAAHLDNRDDGVYKVSHQIYRCISSLNFLILSFGFAGGVAIFSSLSALLEQMLLPLGYTDELTGIITGVMVLAGIIGSLCIGLIADKTKALKSLLQFCLVCASYGLILFSIMIVIPEVKWPLIIALVIFGSFGIPVYSLSLELAGQITYPVNEHVSSGLLLWASQVASFLLILICPYLKQTVKYHSEFWPAAILMTVIALVSASLFLLFFHGQNRREAVEEERQSNQDEDFPSIFE